MKAQPSPNDTPRPSGMTRRSAISAGLAAAGGAAAFGQSVVAAQQRSQGAPDDRQRSPKRYDMKKSINQQGIRMRKTQ